MKFLKLESEYDRYEIVNDIGINLGILEITEDSYCVETAPEHVIYGNQLDEINEFVENLSEEEETPLDRFREAYMEWDGYTDSDEKFGQIVGDFIDTLKPLLEALDKWNENGDRPTEGDRELGEAYNIYKNGD